KLWEAVDRAVAKTGIGDYADRMIRNLSKGYRQRVGIAQAILTDPEIIILDEPTVGLDPRQIIEIRTLIRELGKDHTVILSSHILGEIAEVCDEVIIIAHGEIVAADSLENLVNRYEGKNIVDLTARGDAETVRRIVGSVPGVTGAEIEARPMGMVRARLSADRGTDFRETVFFRFADARIPILSMSYEETTLEKVFLELTQDKPEGVRTAEPDADLPAPGASSDAPFAAPAPEPATDAQEPAEPPTSAVQKEAPAQVPAKPDGQDKPDRSDKPARSGRKKSDDDDYTPLFGG
ncbi:MAG: ATP-binding cassette domain-containing protein, partial [Clostridia bacterium]|nr:ATP-binding cassette domain-containing protein [Clostridia bacterium]